MTHYELFNTVTGKDFEGSGEDFLSQVGNELAQMMLSLHNALSCLNQFLHTWPISSLWVFLSVYLPHT